MDKDDFWELTNTETEQMTLTDLNKLNYLILSEQNM